jgi:acyl-coenzyme A thioesterase PaaI-like protein
MKQMLKKMALSGIANLFAEKMPFNKLIGMQVTHYDFDKVELRIKMEQKLIGNPSTTYCTAASPPACSMWRAA